MVLLPHLSSSFTPVTDNQFKNEDKYETIELDPRRVQRQPSSSEPSSSHDSLDHRPKMMKQHTDHSQSYSVFSMPTTTTGAGTGGPSTTQPGSPHHGHSSPTSNAPPRRSFFQNLTRSNVLIRWFFYITPVLPFIWIPGLLALTLPDRHFAILGVSLLWWSAWLSVAWLGWWAGLLMAYIIPHAFKHTLGVVLPPDFVERWFGFLSSMRKPIMGTVWSICDWIAFNLFIVQNSRDSSQDSRRKLYTALRVAFGFFICSMMLVGEKLLIQIIASYFHKKSYEDRIDSQKRSIRILTILYRRSRDIGRADTLDRAFDIHKESPAKLLKNALKGVKNVAKSTTTVFGTVASEIAGERILQPTSPASMVLSALTSPNKTRQLARRIYYSFVPTAYRDVMVLGDIVGCFGGDVEMAREAFQTFDKDENGDCSLAELELSCLELHRERLALAASMRDLDSAVGRLDSIMMFVWYFISLLILIALMDVSFQTMLASAGTLTLGLSWLIGSTAQEILSSIIFLFIKHPYDVSDRVDVDGVSYVVKEMHLLYTIFRQTDGKISQLPHSVLNTKTVVNIRRSSAISEAFTWDVDFGTSFEKIEALKHRMMNFVNEQRRDFMPGVEITIVDFEGQEKLSLKADIKHKSNWQNGALKAQRRNKWLCALKQLMAELEIYGPGGAGNPAPVPEPQLIQLVDLPQPDSYGKGDRNTERPLSSVAGGLRRVELDQPEAVLQDGLEEPKQEAQGKVNSNKIGQLRSPPEKEEHGDDQYPPV